MPGSAQANTGLLAGYTVGENGWGPDFNKNMRILDMLVQGRVLDKDLNTPPGSPSAGDVYIVGSAPTGAWTGHATKLARWSGAASGDPTNTWEIFTPKAGWEMWVVDESLKYRFNGSAWASI